MKVEQFGYLSPEAKVLRQRDGIRPWQFHPCELDALGRPDDDDVSPSALSWREAQAWREEIERG